MSQLRALMWLKWTLFRNSLRSRKAVAGRAAAAVGTLAGLFFAVAAAAGLGFATYAVVAAGARAEVAADAPVRQATYFFLLVVFLLLYLMWAVVPLGLGGGSQFDAGRMLLYPVSLGKLFAIDFLSELTSLASLFAVPVVFGVALGAGLASGSVARAGLAGFAAAAAGLAFAKLLSTAVGSLMRRQRTRGETVLALLGGVLGLAGAFVGQLVPVVARNAEQFSGVRWTPPGAAAVALSSGLRAGGGGAYAAAVATLAAYAAIFVLVTYRLARRTALGTGGGPRRQSARREAGAGGAAPAGGRYAGWQLPLLSAQLSAVVEKELRYALRNAQLRVIALMAVGLTLVLRLSPLGAGGGAAQGGGRVWGELAPYAEGAGAVFSVLYVFTLVSPLTTNLFGYDGAGMRALVLAPLSRTRLLVGKNIATTSIVLVLAVTAVVANGLIMRDLTWQTVVSAALSFVTYAAVFALVGNWLSLHFPKRVQFGKRMNRSGVAGLLLVPFFFALMVPPALAVAGAYAARSLAVKYAILAAFAVVSAGLYGLLIARQGRALERRELEILEAVTGRAGEDDNQVLG